MAPDHILTILAVEDVARAAAFYGAAFGWPRRVDAGVFVELQLPDGRGLGFYERRSFARNAGQLPIQAEVGEISATEIYLRVPDPSASLAAALAGGGRLLSALAPRPWGDEAAYVADPDGNVLVLARPLPERS